MLLTEVFVLLTINIIIDTAGFGSAILLFVFFVSIHYVVDFYSTLASLG